MSLIIFEFEFMALKLDAIWTWANKFDSYDPITTPKGYDSACFYVLFILFFPHLLFLEVKSNRKFWFYIFPHYDLNSYQKTNNYIFKLPIIINPIPYNTHIIISLPIITSNIRTIINRHFIVYISICLKSIWSQTKTKKTFVLNHLFAIIFSCYEKLELGSYMVLLYLTCNGSSTTS